jgi:signal transduction histidine kinase
VDARGQLRHHCGVRWGTLALVGAGITALAIAIGEAVPLALGQPEAAFWVIPMGAMFLAGLLSATRRPGDLGARRLLLTGCVAIIWNATGFGLALAIRHRGAGNWLVVPDTLQVALDLAMPAAILALFASYPDGRYHRPYERVLVRTGVGLAVLVPLLLLLTRTTLQPALILSWATPHPEAVPSVSSPVHIPALGALARPLSFYAKAGIGIQTGLAVIVLVLRYRRFGEAERLSIRWPLAALSLAALQPVGNALIAAGVIPKASVDAPVIILLTGLAAALAVGLLRPGLFDLGRFVRQSLAYLVLWAILGAVYVGIAAAAGIAASGQGLRVAVAVTIAATLLAAPLRRAVTAWATRRIYGERLRAPELLRRVGAALEHTLEPAELAVTLAQTAKEGLGVEWVRLNIADLEPVIAGRQPAPGAPVGARQPLAYGGQTLGMIECAPAIPPVDGVALGNLARQAALAMGNARLVLQLRERAQQLAASRSRLVQAEETARRRLERDIHDGVQQELVALMAKIALVRKQWQRDPATLEASLSDLQAEAGQALADLRELASGIHPSVLDDHGLVEAIESRASRLPLGVTVECSPELRSTRFPEAIEGAAYFIVCEGFANALKHSGAERITVRLAQEHDALGLEISDDGAGFDPCSVRRSGLAGLADRVEALDGHFSVSAMPGQGARLRATFPIVSRVRA